MEDFTEYDIKPSGFLNYLRYYGNHLNKQLCEYICRQQFDNQYSKEDYINFCTNNNAVCEEKNIYDKTYLYNYYRYLNLDDNNILQIICAILEKEPNMIFNRVLADSAKLGISIDWEDFI